jgi:hypothetical protein
MISGACTIVAVSRSAAHTFGKPNVPVIRLLAGLGIEGDAHAGRTVRHRSRAAVDPTQANLRQVHLIHAELFDLLGLPAGTRLRLGPDAIVVVTGLRNPCAQLDGFQPGLMKAVLDRDAQGGLVRKAGIMGVVVAGGEVRAGDEVAVELPPEPHHRLERV